MLYLYSHLGPEPSAESLEDLDMAERKTVWKLRRHQEFEYEKPSDHYSTVSEHHIELFNTEQRLIYVLSDLHLGGIWSKGMDAKLENYLQYLVSKANEVSEEQKHKNIHACCFTENESGWEGNIFNSIQISLLRCFK